MQLATFLSRLSQWKIGWCDSENDANIFGVIPFMIILFMWMAARSEEKQKQKQQQLLLALLLHLIHLIGITSLSVMGEESQGDARRKP